MNKQILRLELLRKIQASDPTIPADRMVALAEELEAIGAYSVVGTQLVPTGNRAAMAKALALAPRVFRAISTEHIAAASASSAPEVAAIDRARARLQGLGIDLDEALAGDSETGRDFYGLDINNLPPRGAA